MRYAAERTTGQPGRKLPNPEREVRRQRIARRLVGMDIDEDDEFDPAHSTSDSFVKMHDDDQIEYVGFDACLPRAVELAEKKWSVNPSERDGLSLRISNLLVRRGIAGEMGGICSFEAHDKIRRRLVKDFTKEPVDPRYAKPSYDQLVNADKFIWKEVSKICRKGVRARCGGPCPADAAIDTVLASHDPGTPICGAARIKSFGLLGGNSWWWNGAITPSEAQAERETQAGRSQCDHSTQQAIRDSSFGSRDFR